jgi:hypothetical protein
MLVHFYRTARDHIQEESIFHSNKYSGLLNDVR